MRNNSLDPDNFGWDKSTEGYLFLNLGYVQTFPDSVTGVCGCTSGCKEESRCSCRKIQLPCNDDCTCTDKCTHHINNVVEVPEQTEEEYDQQEDVE